MSGKKLNSCESPIREDDESFVDGDESDQRIEIDSNDED
jgi:hypothetical protein